MQPPQGVDLAIASSGLTKRFRGGQLAVDRVDLAVPRGAVYGFLGPNGSGKTTLLAVAGARLWPTAGTVEILGQRLGSVDLRTLRSRVAFVSGAVIRELRSSQLVREVVASGKFGALETWWHHYGDEDWAEVERLLAETEASAAS